MNDIDILEELKEWFNNFDLDSIKHKPEEYIQAISTLIAENKELKEDNRALERRLRNSNNRYKKLNDNFQRCQIKTTDIVNSKYISKSKVEEAIDKLNKKEKDLQNSISDEEREEYSDVSISFGLMDIDIRRETLQSLLGKE